MEGNSQLVQDLKNYLSSMSEMVRSIRPDMEYSCIEDFVLKNGQFFSTFSKMKVPKGRQKECFSNAAKLLDHCPNLEYCEGYAVFSDIPIPIYHAWVIDEKGEVIDNTIRKENEHVYCGVVFSQKYLYSTILEKKTYGLIDNMEMHFPLLTGKHKNFKKELRWDSL